MTRKGLPKPSTVRWILQLNPPQLRPSACSPCFFARLPHRDARAQSWHQSCRVRCRDRWRAPPASAPTRPLRTSAQTACPRRSTRHTQRAASAIARHSDSSTSPLPRSGGRSVRLGPHTPATPGARTPGSCSTPHHSIEYLSCLHSRGSHLNVNRT